MLVEDMYPGQIDKMNGHWLPLSLSRCGFCSIPFTGKTGRTQLKLEKTYKGQ